MRISFFAWASSWWTPATAVVLKEVAAVGAGNVQVALAPPTEAHEAAVGVEHEQEQDAARSKILLAPQLCDEIRPNAGACQTILLQRAELLASDAAAVCARFEDACGRSSDPSGSTAGVRTGASPAPTPASADPFASALLAGKAVTGSGESTSATAKFSVAKSEETKQPQTLEARLKVFAKSKREPSQDAGNARKVEIEAERPPGVTESTTDLLHQLERREALERRKSTPEELYAARQSTLYFENDATAPDGEDGDRSSGTSMNLISESHKPRGRGVTELTRSNGGKAFADDRNGGAGFGEESGDASLWADMYRGVKGTVFGVADFFCDGCTQESSGKLQILH
mmetsp:Transcript_22291/g.56344  ORF Transcript_22291/g.56344 Transcript_22291/m.56344 type:complete len:343 (+) Transcript_22291:159-1187(+)|eukprot:g995.t1